MSVENSAVASVSRVPNRRKWSALTAAAAAVSLIDLLAYQARAGDLYSFDYGCAGSPVTGPKSPDLTLAANWFDDITMANGAAVPGSGDFVQFDSNITHMNPTSTTPSFGFTLSPTQVTSWSSINVNNPGVNPTYVVGGVTSAFVMSLTGVNSAGLAIGSGALTVSGTDTAINVPVTINSAQTWTVQNVVTTINGAVLNSTALQLNNGLSLNGLGTNALTINGGGNTNIASAISDGGVASGIAMNGAGTLTLGGANTYTGPTNLNAGTVAISQSTGLGAAGGAVNFNGGTLQLTGTAATNLSAYSVNGSATGAGATWQNFNLNLNAASSVTQFHIPQVLSGTLALNASGSGMVILDNANDNFTGGLTINPGGTVVINSISQVTGGNGGTHSVTDNGSLQFAGSGSYSGSLVIGTGILNAGVGNLDINGVVSGIALGAINDATLTLDQSNTTTPVVNAPTINPNGGATAISGATLSLSGGHVNVLANASPVIIPFATTNILAGPNFINAPAGVTVNLGFANYTTLGTVTHTGTTVTTTQIVTNTTINRSKVAAGATIVFNGPVTGTVSPFQVYSNSVGETWNPIGKATILGTSSTTNGTPFPSGNIGTVVINNGVSPSTTVSTVTATAYQGYYTPFATYGLTDFAVIGPELNGTAYIVPASTYANFYTVNTPNVEESLPHQSANTPVNFDIVNPGLVHFGGNAVFDALRFNSPTGGATTFGGNGPANNIPLQFGLETGLTESPFFLETPNVGANNLLIDSFTAASAGTSSIGIQPFDTRTTTQQDYMIWDNNSTSGAMMIFSVGFANTQVGATVGMGAMTIQSTITPTNGPGIVVLDGTSTYSGPTVINGSIVEIPFSAALGDSSPTNTLTLNGGSLIAASTLTLDNGVNSNRNIVLGATGGGLAAATGVTLTVDGVISGIGSLTVGTASVFQTATADSIDNVITTGSSTGNGTVVFTAANTYAGGTTINAGWLQLGAGGTSGSVVGTISDATSLIINRSDAAVTIANNISGAGSVTNIGSGTATLTGVNTYGTTAVSAGTLVIGSTTALPSGHNVSVAAGSQLVLGATSNAGVISNLGTVAVNANSTFAQITGNTGALTIGQVGTPATARLAFTTPTSGAPLGPVSTVGSLTINTGSTLDITNHEVQVVYGGGADPATTLNADLKAAYGATGSGYGAAGLAITSHAATGTAAGKFVIGNFDNTTAAPIGAFPAHSYTFGFTVPGDTDLSGAVTFTDLSNVAKNFGKSGAAATWQTGDVNYDGAVTFADLSIVAKGFGNSLTGQFANELPGSFVAQYDLALAEIGANGGPTPTSVPEPSMVSLLAVGAAGLLARRRRKASN